MKNKWAKISVIMICTLLVLWAAVFTTDYMRCSSLKAPLFVVAKETATDDIGSGTYQGLGYTVDVEKHVDAQYGICVISVEMKLFGKVIAASIT